MIEFMFISIIKEKSNNLLQKNEIGLQTSLTYDTRGNVLSRTTGGLTTSYSYLSGEKLKTSGFTVYRYNVSC